MVRCCVFVSPYGLWVCLVFSRVSPLLLSCVCVLYVGAVHCFLLRFMSPVYGLLRFPTPTQGSLRFHDPYSIYPIVFVFLVSVFFCNSGHVLFRLVFILILKLFVFFCFVLSGSALTVAPYVFFPGILFAKDTGGHDLQPWWSFCSCFCFLFSL